GGLPEVGKFKQITNAAIDFKVGKKDISIPRDRVERVILYESKYGRNIAKQGAIGAGVGAVVGGLFGLAVGDDHRTSSVYISRRFAALVLGAAGGLVGFVAGTIMGTVRGPETSPTVIYDKSS